jgi:hypothetical protein
MPTFFAASANAARPLTTAVVDTWGQVTDRALAFERVRASGASKVRMPLFWSTVAPSEPTVPTNPDDPAYKWTSFDEQIALAVANGLDPIVYVSSAPSWAVNTALGGNSTTPYVDDLFAFATAAATRYNGIDRTPDDSVEPLPRVRYWQAWNEPNIAMFLIPQHVNGRFVSPANYRRMVNAFSNAVKSVPTDDGTRNLVLAGGTAPFDGSGPGPLRFMRMMLCLDTYLRPIAGCPPSHFDIWGHHPYTQGGPNHHAYTATSISLGDLPEMRRVLNAAIKGGKIVPNPNQPVLWWADEFSWDTSPRDPYTIGPDVHARWVAEALYRMWSSGISLVTWFQVKDEPIATSRYQSGLHYPDGRRKPAFQAFRFPFVALAKNGRLTVWGRVPPPFALGERVVVQRWAGSRWVRATTLTTSRHGIFSARWRTAQTRGYFRAVLANGRVSPSLKFGISPTRDISLEMGPFGCGGPFAC